MSVNEIAIRICMLFGMIGLIWYANIDDSSDLFLKNFAMALIIFALFAIAYINIETLFKIVVYIYKFLKGA